SAPARQGPLQAGGGRLIRRSAGDRKAAWEMMSSLRDLLAGEGGERGPALLRTLKGIATEIATHEPEALPALAENLASAVMALDPASRRDLLGSRLPIEGTRPDLASAPRAP